MSEQPRIEINMLFAVTTFGDGCRSVLAQGRDELRAYLLAALWMGTAEEAPPDVVETIDSLDDPDEWSGGYYPDRDPFWTWSRSYEDGAITIQRVQEAAVFDRRITELLAANTAEVERRRAAEAEVERLEAQLRAVKILPRGSDCMRRVYDLVAGAAEITVNEIAGKLDSLPRKSINNALGYLTRKGKVERLAYGRYRLPAGLGLVSDEPVTGD